MSIILDRDIMREPYYEVYLGGKKLDEKLKKYITEVSVEQSDSEAHLGRITIMDRDMIFLNNKELTKKMSIKIIMGHRKHYKEQLSGEVTHIEADFGEDGIPIIVIGAIDKTSEMTNKKKSRTWKNRTSSSVVHEIAKSYGFKTKIQDTKEVVEQITQDNETDAQLISKLADDEAYQWYLIQDTKELYFGSRFSEVVAKGTLHYKGGNHAIIGFRPNFVEKNKEVEEKSSNISPTTGTTVTKTATTKTSSTSSKTVSKATNKSTFSGISESTGKVVPQQFVDRSGKIAKY